MMTFLPFLLVNVLGIAIGFNLRHHLLAEQITVLRQRLLRAHQLHAQCRAQGYAPSTRLIRYVYRRQIQAMAASCDAVILDSETANKINSLGGAA